MEIITTPDGNVMTKSDNLRLYLLEKAMQNVGDQFQAIKDLKLQSPQARTARRNAEAMMVNVDTYLKATFEAEHKLAVKNGKKAAKEAA